MLRVIFIVFFAWICAESKGQAPTYKIDRIKRSHGYYLIYVVKGDSTYKVISKKEKSIGGKKVRKGENYAFKLSRIKLLGGPEVNCFSFNRSVVFCREPNIEMAYVSNLKGLRYFEK